MPQFNVFETVKLTVEMIPQDVWMFTEGPPGPSDMGQ